MSNLRKRYSDYRNYTLARAEGVDGKNPEKGSFSVVLNKEKGQATINIRGEVGWEVRPDEVADQIGEIDAKEIRVNINSPGGSLFGGRAIANALRSHPAEVTTVNEALAASVAAVIFAAGDKRIMMEGSELMIHRAMTVSFAMGNEEELSAQVDKIKATIKILRQFDAGLAKTFAERSGRDVDEIADFIKAESWFSETDAVELGLATEGDPINARKKKAKEEAKPPAGKDEPSNDPANSGGEQLDLAPPEPENHKLDSEFADEYFPFHRLRNDAPGLDVLAP